MSDFGASPRAVIVGAGMGGLSAALSLAAAGWDVTVAERAAAPGGKMRQIAVGGAPIDAGPTVFTMKWAFDAILAEAGLTTEAVMRLAPAATLARHVWPQGPTFDLFADVARSADAIGDLFGAREAAGYRRFCADAGGVFATLKDTFLTATRPDLWSFGPRVGLHRLDKLLALRPFATLWDTLGAYFADPRLRQLFARYATYTGCSPFAAPATLMLIAHVEQEGVWLVEGGMHAVAQGFQAAAEARGARFRFGAEVEAVVVERGRAAGVRLTGGERLAADAVLLNADADALAGGLFGADAAGAVAPAPSGARSLSAVTWAMRAQATGAGLLRHTVFFSDDYRAEFDAIFGARRPPQGRPTVYVCAQDRGDDDAPLSGPERLLILVNAPAIGADLPAAEVEACQARTFRHLADCGLTLTQAACVRTTPADWAQLFPGTRGAIYGRATHGWNAPFRRPGHRTAIAGLYLAGGSVHPGAGVPMAALSGWTAARAATADRASTRRPRPAAIAGGMSTPSATTAGTG